MLSPRVVITGGNGFVGNHLIRMLLEQGYKVTSIDREPNYNPLSGVEYLSQDLESVSNQQLQHILKDSIIVHLAAISSSPLCEERPNLAIDVNIKFILKLIEIANISNATIIFASSEWVYPDSTEPRQLEENFPIELTTDTNMYAMSKVVGEWLLKRYCQNHSILRFGIVYGERHTPQSSVEKIVQLAVNNDVIEIGNLHTARRFIHVEDICRGIIKCIEEKNLALNNVFNLAGDKLVRLGDIVDLLQDYLDNPLSLKIGDTKSSIRNPTVSSFYSTFNWFPQIQIAHGIERLVNWELGKKETKSHV